MREAEALEGGEGGGRAVVGVFLGDAVAVHGLIVWYDYYYCCCCCSGRDGGLISREEDMRRVYVYPGVVEVWHREGKEKTWFAEGLGISRRIGALEVYWRDTCIEDECNGCECMGWRWWCGIHVLWESHVP